MRQLQNVSEALKYGDLKPEYLHSVRWVASKTRTLNTVRRRIGTTLFYTYIIMEASQNGRRPQQELFSRN
jgi:hypothetical protein